MESDKVAVCNRRPCSRGCGQPGWEARQGLEVSPAWPCRFVLLWSCQHSTVLLILSALHGMAPSLGECGPLQARGHWAPMGTVLQHCTFTWLLLSSCHGSRTTFHWAKWWRGINWSWFCLSFGPHPLFSVCLHHMVSPHLLTMVLSWWESHGVAQA